MEVIMSIRFDPRNYPAEAYNVKHTSEKPKFNFFHQVVDDIYDGHRKEVLPVREYCKGAWVKQTGKKDSEITEIFKKECSEYVFSYRTYCDWSRLN